MQKKLEFIINTFLTLKEAECKVLNTEKKVEIIGKKGSIFNRKKFVITIKDNPNNDETAFVTAIKGGISKSIDLQKNILFDILEKANLFDKNVIYGLNNIFWNYKISKQNNKITVIRPKTNNHSANCPYIGKVYNCIELDMTTMKEGKKGLIKVNIDSIEILNKHIPCVFEKKIDNKYYFKGTKDLHQIILSEQVVTHTTMDGTNSYILN